jgi:adenine phosphoribosyltransferase
MSIEQKIKAVIRDVPDFPKEGIMFKDITPVFLDPELRREITKAFCERVSNIEVDVIVGIESRGLLFGMLMSEYLNIPFVPIRKKGKLPADTFGVDYDLEYGTASIEIHKDALQPGQKVLLHDDLLATGGTIIASSELIKLTKAQLVGFTFLVELDFLNARQKLSKYSDNIITLANY